MTIAVKALIVSGAAASIWCAAHVGAEAAPCAAGLLTGAAALASSGADDRPGLCRQILATDLPPPSVSHSRKPEIVARPKGMTPQVPPGFTVSRLLRNDHIPRLIRTAPNGDIFVAESHAGQIRVLRPGSACALEAQAIFASGLFKPFGISFYPPGPNPQYVYVAENHRVVRYPYSNGVVKAATALEVVVPDLPQGADNLPGKGHWTRDVVFSADGSTMYVSVGSFSNSQNAGEDESRRARILAYNPDGTNGRIYAWGLRNPVSMSVSPVTGQLWTTNNERDELGDDLVPDFVTAVQPGEFFGWPWYYIGANLDPRHPNAWRLDLPPAGIPDVLLQAHTASLGSTFYTGAQFPAEYHGSLFVAAHGSWNRSEPVGGKIIRLVFDAAGNALPYYEDFMTGFAVSADEVWGRPVGVAVGADGSLFVSEDANSTIWCVRYVGVPPG